MNLIKEGYEMAMSQYKTMLQNNNSLKSSNISNDSSLNKVSKESSKPSNSDFKDLISENIVSGKSYDVGGYKISIPALNSTEIQNKIKSNNIDEIVEMASDKYGVDKALIYKIIETESYFNTNAVSHAGASGLMQIMPFNFSSLGISNPFDPYENIMGGVKLFKQYLNMQNGDVKLALASYNAGPGNVHKYGGVPPFQETQNYIKKILGENA